MLFEILVGLGIFALYKKHKHKNSHEKREWKLGNQAWYAGRKDLAFQHYQNAVQLHNHRVDIEIQKLHLKASEAQMKNKTVKVHQCLEKAAALNRSKLPPPTMGVLYDPKRPAYQGAGGVQAGQPPVQPPAPNSNSNVNPNYFAPPPYPAAQGPSNNNDNNNNALINNPDNVGYWSPGGVPLMQAPVAQPVLYSNYPDPSPNPPNPPNNPNRPNQSRNYATYPGNSLQEPLLMNPH